MPPLELELSVTPLYEGQPSLAEMLPLLAERGFRPVCMEPIQRIEGVEKCKSFNLIRQPPTM